jgi:tetratricopeptide (TPR) repeat protein
VSRPRLGAAAALLLSAAGVLCYANGLTGEFTYDDKAIVRDNPRIRSPDQLEEIFVTEYFGRAKGTGTSYRPMLLVSYALQWWIHGGAVVPYHLVNLGLHVLTTFLIAMLWLRLDIPRSGAIASALLFAVHPIHVEAVTSVVGRGETQAAALTLGYALLALRSAEEGRGRRGAAIGTALLLYFLAALTKESATAAPALAALALAWKAEGGLLARVRTALLRGWRIWLGSAAVLGLVFLLRRAVLGGPIQSPRSGTFELENPLAALAWLPRVLNASLLVVRYVGRMALPLRLSADESAWSIRPVDARSPVGWAALLLIAAVSVCAALRLSRRRPAALGWLFLVTAFLPAANLLFPIGTNFAERLAYLPSAGFCLIVGTWISGSEDAEAPLYLARRRVLTAVALLLAARTVVRNPVWAGDEALFSNMVRVSPASAKSHYDYAYMSWDVGETRRSLVHYTRATEIYPRYWDAWAGRGRIERALGRLEKAERAYEESVRIAPAYENGYYGLGLTREDRGDRAGAEKAYRTGLRWSPQSLPLAYRFALLLSAEKKPAALFAWRRALAIAPGSLPARLGYAEWLRGQGRSEENDPRRLGVLRLVDRHFLQCTLSSGPMRSSSRGCTPDSVRRRAARSATPGYRR